MRAGGRFRGTPTGWFLIVGLVMMVAFALSVQAEDPMIEIEDIEMDWAPDEAPEALEARPRRANPIA